MGTFSLDVICYLSWGYLQQHLIVASSVIRFYLSLYRYKNIGVQLISVYRHSDTPKFYFSFQQVLSKTTYIALQFAVNKVYCHHSHVKVLCNNIFVMSNTVWTEHCIKDDVKLYLFIFHSQYISILNRFSYRNVADDFGINKLFDTKNIFNQC